MNDFAVGKMFPKPAGKETLREKQMIGVPHQAPVSCLLYYIYIYIYIYICVCVCVYICIYIYMYIYI